MNIILENCSQNIQNIALELKQELQLDSQRIHGGWVADVGSSQERGTCGPSQAEEEAKQMHQLQMSCIHTTSVMGRSPLPRRSQVSTRTYVHMPS